MRISTGHDLCQMGNGTSQSYQLQQQITNDIIQQNQQNCTQLNSSIDDDNSVYVLNSYVGGNVIGASQAVSTDVTCVITSGMSSQVESMLKSTADQGVSDESGLISQALSTFQSGTDQSLDIEQRVINSISQLNTSLCQAAQITSASDNLVYVSNSDVAGDVIGVTTSSDFSSTCSLTNIAKLRVSSDLSSDSKQDITRKSALAHIVTVVFVAFLLIIGFILLLILLLIFK